jgi:hypothetical protein
MARSTLIAALAALLAALTVAVSGAAAAPSAYEAGVLADSPLVYYRLADAGPLPDLRSMRDSSTRAKHGEYNFLGSVTLGQPSAIAADSGSDSSVSCGGCSIGTVSTPGLPTGDSARTIEAWYKSATSDQVSRQAIAGWGNSGAVGQAFSLQVQGQKLWVDVGFAQAYFLAEPNIQDGAWHHLAVTYDPAATTKYTGYVDGVASSTLSFEALPIDLASPLDTADTELSVGTWVATYHLNGSIDELAIYGTALSADRIASRHAQAAGGDCAGAPEPTDSQAITCVTAEVASEFSVRVTPPAVSFGKVVAGKSFRMPQDIEVEKNTAEGGYQLNVMRTAFTPSDLNLGITCFQGDPDPNRVGECTPPATSFGGALAWALRHDTPTEIAKSGQTPAQEATKIGSRATGMTGTADQADRWIVNLVLGVPEGAAAGRYSSVVTYSVVALP